MDHASFKKVLIGKLSTAPLIEAFQANDIELVTAVGFIHGRLTVLKDLTKEDPSSEEGFRIIAKPTEPSKSILAHLADAAAESYREQCGIPIDISLPGNDGSLSLHDVTIRDFLGNTTTYHELEVFFDQIIAVTLVGHEQ